MGNADPVAPRGIIVKSVPIELFRFIKFGGLAQSGGEAKACISEGEVFVNGTPETRKRRKLVTGDQVTLGDRTIVVQLDILPAGPGKMASRGGMNRPATAYVCTS